MALLLINKYIQLQRLISIKLSGFDDDSGVNVTVNAFNNVKNKTSLDVTATIENFLVNEISGLERTFSELVGESIRGNAKIAKVEGEFVN